MSRARPRYHIAAKVRRLPAQTYLDTGVESRPRYHLQRSASLCTGLHRCNILLLWPGVEVWPGFWPKWRRRVTRTSPAFLD